MLSALYLGCVPLAISAAIRAWMVLGAIAVSRCLNTYSRGKRYVTWGRWELCMVLRVAMSECHGWHGRMFRWMEPFGKHCFFFSPSQPRNRNPHYYNLFCAPNQVPRVSKVVA
eukprot:scaffold140353_cov32-Tisochrysis_lutea.AAC.1